MQKGLKDISFKAKKHGKPRTLIMFRTLDLIHYQKRQGNGSVLFVCLVTWTRSVCPGWSEVA